MRNSPSYDRKALRRLRKARGLDVPTLARKAQLNERTVYYLDRGMTVPRGDTLMSLCRALEVSPDVFFPGA